MGDDRCALLFPAVDEIVGGGCTSVLPLVSIIRGDKGTDIVFACHWDTGSCKPRTYLSSCMHMLLSVMPFSLSFFCVFCVLPGWMLVRENDAIVSHCLPAKLMGKGTRANCFVSRPRFLFVSSLVSPISALGCTHVSQPSQCCRARGFGT